MPTLNVTKRLMHSLVSMQGYREIEPMVMYPVRVFSVHGRNWRRKARNAEELEQYVKEGLCRSGVGEVEVAWSCTIQ